MGAVVGAPGVAAGGRGGGGGGAADPGPRVRVSGLRPPVQAQVFVAQPPEVGVWQGASVPVPLLRLPRQAEDAHRSSHGENAPRPASQTGSVH